MRCCYLPALALCMVGCLSGCSSDSAPAPEPPPDLPPADESGLGDEPIPEDFTFQATRPTEVEVTAPSGGGEQEGERRVLIEVRSATYGVMYRGSLLAGAAFRFDYPLPPDVTQLEVRTIDDSGVVTTQLVPVDPAAVALNLTAGGGS